MIHIGTKRTERKLGWVADFCPICRVPRAFQLFRMGQATTIYGVALGPGTELGYEIGCADCGTRLSIEKKRHATVEKVRPADLSYLVLKTLPTMPEMFAERFALEGQIRQGVQALDSETRQRCILEPFSLLNPELEKRRENSEVDRPAALGCVGTLVFIGLAIYAITQMPPAWQEQAAIATAILAGAGFLYAFIQIGLSARRFHRRIILKKVARALGPLQPTREELQAALETCRQQKLIIGKWTTLEKLWPKLYPLRQA